MWKTPSPAVRSSAHGQLRGTLHFVAPHDIRWMLKHLAPRVVAAAARRHRELELDEATFARSTKIFTRALQGGKVLTRPEMMELLERSKIVTAISAGITSSGSWP
jgi:hypothetical protein